MQFIKEHGKLISNLGVVILVLGAIYVKAEEQGTESLFQMNDLYIFAGAILAMLLLRFLSRKQGTKRNK